MHYQRVLRLPCDDIRSGIGFKATLDAALKQLLEALFKASDGFKIEFGDHTGGHLRAIIKRGDEKIEVEGCYGQNSRFDEDKKVSFVSYTVRADAAVGSAGPSANTSENAEMIGKIAGVVVSVALSCAIMSPLMHKSGKFILLLPIFIALVYAGKLLGVRAARTIVGATQSKPASSGKDASQASAVWKRLIHAIESVTDNYPTA
ncbi:MAG TPA: hypothetical protein VK850_00680 [Candidatus Binatia bacterium]|nr:hypothetical protein [Candidatus Binatia bacterium]